MLDVSVINPHVKRNFSFFISRRCSEEAGVDTLADVALIRTNVLKFTFRRDSAETDTEAHDAIICLMIMRTRWTMMHLKTVTS